MTEPAKLYTLSIDRIELQTLVSELRAAITDLAEAEAKFLDSTLVVTHTLRRARAVLLRAEPVYKAPNDTQQGGN